MRALLALPCLLALATSASAECAWVLCGQTQDPWGAVAVIRLGGGAFLPPRHRGPANEGEMTKADDFGA